MGLLGMPGRLPVLRQLYRMPPALYDPYDRTGHPTLVVSLDPVLKQAEVVTRTTKIYAKGRRYVAHPPQPDLGLGQLGWWRLDRSFQVSYASFDGPDVEPRGSLDEQTWRLVMRALTGEGSA